MKPNNKLNQALKDALFEHPEPLHDGQWERLRAELEEKKKRRFLPWFFLFAGVLLCAGLVYLYINGDGNKIAIQEQMANHQTNSHTSDSTIISNTTNELPLPESATASTNEGDPTVKSGKMASQPRRNTHTSPSNSYATTVQQSIDDGHGPSLKEDYSGSKKDLIETVNHETPGGMLATGDKGQSVKTNEEGNNNNKTINSDSGKNSSKDPALKTILVADGNTTKNQLKKDDLTSTGAESNKDTTKKSDTTKGPGEDKKKVKWVFGLNAGYAVVNSVVTGLTNEEQLHKDSRNIFKMGNDKQSAMFYNFNVEYRFSQKIGLRMNTGLNYRLLNNNVDFTYKLSQVPVRLPDNTILTYITIPDTSNPLIFRLRENQSYSFLSIPLYLNYSLPINAQSELILGGGVNISALIGSTGSAFSLNEMSYKKSGDMIKHPFNLGMSLSLGYSRRLFGNWWLGADFGMQSMGLKYDLGYGDLKSRMNSRSFGLNIRYKLLK